MTLLSSLAGGSASPRGSISTYFPYTHPALVEQNGDFYVKTGTTVAGLPKATRDRIAAKSTDFMVPGNYAYLGGQRQANFTSLAYGNGVYLRGTSLGLLRSTDGVSWTPVETFYAYPGFNTAWAAPGVTFGNGVFVAAASPPSNNRYVLVYTSADGLTWTASRLATATGTAPDGSVGPAAVSFDGSAFYVGVKAYDGNALSYYDTLFRSTDGLSWSMTAQLVSNQSAITAPWVVVSSGAGNWVAITAYVSGTNNSYFATSTNGTSWTSQTATTSLTDGVTSIRYLNGQFIATTSKTTTTTQIYTSPTGASWTARTSASGGTTFRDVAYGAGLYVAVADGGVINTSPDGVTWTARTSNAGGSNISTVRYDATLGLFIALHATGVTTSSDGVTWTSTALPNGGGRSAGVNAGANTLAKLNGVWYAAAGGSEGLVSSTNGTTWATVLNTDALGPTGLASTGRRNLTDSALMIANDTLFACPSTGTLIAAPVATNAWSTRISGATVWACVAWSPTLGLYVAVGGGGAIQTSPDGTTWTARTSGTATSLHSVVWTGAEFIAMSSSYTARSTDGVSWASVSLSGYTMMCVSDGRVYAYNGSGGLATSVTGAAGTWTTIGCANYTTMRPITGGLVLYGGSNIGYGVLLTGGTVMPLMTNLTFVDAVEQGGVLLLAQNGVATMNFSTYPHAFSSSRSTTDGTVDSEYVNEYTSLDYVSGNVSTFIKLGDRMLICLGASINSVMYAQSNLVGLTPLSLTSLTLNSLSASAEYGQHVWASNNGIVWLPRTAVTSASARLSTYGTQGASIINSTAGYNPHSMYRKIT